MTFTVKVGSTTLPTPKASGAEFTHNRIWSDDAGRTASGSAVGTVKATKRSIKLSWPRLSGANANTVINAALNGDFVALKYTGLTGSETTVTGYFSSPSYTIVRGGVVDGLTVEFIEQ